MGECLVFFVCDTAVQGKQGPPPDRLATQPRTSRKNKDHYWVREQLIQRMLLVTPWRHQLAATEAQLAATEAQLADMISASCASVSASCAARRSRSVVAPPSAAAVMCLNLSAKKMHEKDCNTHANTRKRNLHAFGGCFCALHRTVPDQQAASSLVTSRRRRGPARRDALP